MSVKAWFGIYLRGVCMGAADAVPGVSGGTIALITGIYERLVRAITQLDPRLLEGLRRGHTAAGREELVGDLTDADIPFLLVLGAGIATAVLTVTRLIEVALETHRAVTFAFFFGLIGASAVVLGDEISLDSPGRIAAGITGFLGAFFLSGLTGSGGVPHSLPVVFLAGAVAITAMILPGISGAFLLLLLGQYHHLISTLTAFVDALLSLVGGGSPDLVGPGGTVITFLAGAVVGLLTVAHVIRWALTTYRAATLTFLVALMVGALRVPGVEVMRSTPSFGPATILTLVGAASLGGALVIGLEYATGGITY